MLQEWLEDAAEPLEARAAQVGWRRTVERDLQRAMEEGRPASSSRRVVLRHWPAVGAIDLVAEGGLAVELKWSKSGDGLSNSAWDIAKLATALAEGQLDYAWIVAGAPVAHWRSRAAGVELFRPDSYNGDALIRKYESWWRFWAKTSRPALQICQKGSSCRTP